MDKEAPVIRRSSLKPFTGPFSYDGFILRANIKAIHSEYDKHDPKTWPLITQDKIRESQGRDYDGRRSLPYGADYDSHIVYNWVVQHPGEPTQFLTSAKHEIFRSFWLFPFHFDKNGINKQDVEMTIEEHEAWMLKVTGFTPNSTNSMTVDEDASVIKASDLRLFAGSFSNNQGSLRANIEEAYPDYDETDPKTWVRIPTDKIWLAVGHVHIVGEISRRFVFCKQSVAKAWVLTKASNLEKLKLKGVNPVFQHFPFNFDESGGLRAQEEMTMEEYNTWVRKVIGLSPTAKKSEIVGSIVKNEVSPKRTIDAQVPRFRLRVQSRSQLLPPLETPGKDTPKEDSVAPRSRRDVSEEAVVDQHLTNEVAVPADVAYNKVIEILTKDPASAAVKLENIQSKMMGIRNELFRETRRADAAEEQMSTLEQKYKIEIMRTEKAETELADCKKLLSKEVERANKANVFVKIFQQQCKKETNRAHTAEGLVTNLEERCQNEFERADMEGRKTQLLEQRLQERDEQLSISRKETAESNQRIVEIWTKMKKYNAITSSSIAASPLGKRSMTESDIGVKEENISKRSKPNATLTTVHSPL